MNKISALLPFSLLLTSSCNHGGIKESYSIEPNIIYILADDLGYGDLSCYGQEKFNTPNIDYLAENGIKFTQHYSGSTVCAPSRSSLMTGQHTGNTFIRGNKGMPTEGQYPLEASTMTVARFLQEAGYATGAFGKWGLGSPGSEGDPNNQGFDEFFGYNCQSLAHHYFPYHLWHNQEKIILEGNEGKNRGEYAPDLIHEQALRFIESNKDKPFFLYYPSLIPHADMDAPDDYMSRYRGKFDPEPAYKGVDDGERFRKGPYISQTEPYAAFAAMINVLDDQVGEIIAKLKELGIYENTIIMFSSDNGPHREGGANPDYFNSNGIFRGYKRDLYEGGIRVPMLAVWKNKIKPGSITGHSSAFWDIFPTVAEIIDTVPPDGLDGVSFLPTLLGNEKKQAEHEYLYWEFHELNGRRALLKGEWKLVSYNVFNPSATTTELYNLANDPGEQNNVAAQHPELVEELTRLMLSARTESEVFPFETRISSN
jgi:arylsulfatase A